LDPARAYADWGKALHCVTSGPTPKGNTFVMYHWHGWAAGAMRGRDGFPTMGTVPTLCGSERIFGDKDAGFVQITPSRVASSSNGEIGLRDVY
jgi:hypothetical protein